MSMDNDIPLGDGPAFQPPRSSQPAAAHPMTMMPTGQGQAQQMAMVGNAKAQGRSSYSQEDATALAARATTLAQQMMARGASDAEIQQAVGNLAGNNSELASVARDAAQRQMDADKFNLFSNRNSEQSQDAQRMEVLDMGPTTAALALIGLKGGFTPTPVRDVRPASPDRGASLT